MSLYGIDLLEKNDGDYIICEINGVNSGMKGFKEVYGDDRVRKQVNKMLEERYGKITVNEGSHRVSKFRKEHPITSKILDVLWNFFPGTMYDLKKLSTSTPEILKSDKAFTDWKLSDEEIEEITDDDFQKTFGLPFERYIGQESTVLNLVNERIDEETVNEYVTEDITRNKLFQYNLLKDSAVGGKMIETVPIGLGATKDENIEKYLEDYDRFVRKPVRGACGSGVIEMSRKDLINLKGREGPVDSKASVFEKAYLATDIITNLLVENDLEGFANITEEEYEEAYNRSVRKVFKYIEDYIRKDDYSFEKGLAVLQPFVDTSSSLNYDKQYSSIRAIVCNGEYVDSYRRVDKDPVVNLSRTAEAEAHDEGYGFRQLCETAAELLEENSEDISEKDHRKELYRENFDRKVF